MENTPLMLAPGCVCLKLLNNFIFKVMIYFIFLSYNPLVNDI